MYQLTPWYIWAERIAIPRRATAARQDTGLTRRAASLNAFSKVAPYQRQGDDPCNRKNPDPNPGCLAGKNVEDEAQDCEQESTNPDRAQPRHAPHRFNRLHFISLATDSLVVGVFQAGHPPRGTPGYRDKRARGKKKWRPYDEKNSFERVAALNNLFVLKQAQHKMHDCKRADCSHCPGKDTRKDGNPCATIVCLHRFDRTVEVTLCGHLLRRPSTSKELVERVGIEPTTPAL
jgi:hypothetical protein